MTHGSVTTPSRSHAAASQYEPIIQCGERVHAPQVFPSGGIYAKKVCFVIKSETDGAKLRYTLDGSTPNEVRGIEIENGSIICVDACATLKAVALKSGLAPSEIIEASYVIAPLVAIPHPRGAGEKNSEHLSNR